MDDDFDLEDIWYCPRCKKEFTDDEVLPLYDGCVKCPVCKKILYR